MKLLNCAGVENAMCTIAFLMLRRWAAGASANELLACTEHVLVLSMIAVYRIDPRFLFADYGTGTLAPDPPPSHNQSYVQKEIKTFGFYLVRRLLGHTRQTLRRMSGPSA